ncbi:hypothetical protein [Streptomyces sp. NPDC002825]|uniref:hypothetical protein n=1 Tax=Streptomyces sp. NPDC002825 TaxID=3154666 RepID=UPI00332DFCA6
MRADTATARAALAEIRAEIPATDATEVDLDVDIDTTGAQSALMSLGIQMAILMAIPLGPVLAAGLGWALCTAWSARTVAKPGSLDLYEAKWGLEIEATASPKDAIYGHRQVHTGRFRFLSDETVTEAPCASSTMKT